jgi:uncharacterized membrane protein YphA (DoxX/SURF4 family)
MKKIKRFYLRNEKKIVNLTRITIGLVFILSALGKLLPTPSVGLGLFEAKTLIKSGVYEEIAPYISRFLVVLEVVIGIMILKRDYFKLGASVARYTLMFFIVYLTYDLVLNGNKSDCGCFGSLMSMSTSSSILKNIVLLSLIRYISSKNIDKLSISGVYLLISSVTICVLLISPVKIDEHLSSNLVDTPYSEHFEDLKSDLKVLCFFSPDCEHCKETGKKLGAIKNLPSVRIIFADESADLIPEFYRYTGLKANHKVLSLEDFAEEFFIEHDVPGVMLLENGHPIHLFDGIEDNEYDDKLFRQLINIKSEI